MPELRLNDWLITALAQLEREYGRARLLMGPARDLALTQLAATRTGALPDFTGRAAVDIADDRLALRGDALRVRIYRLHP